jgi:TonB-linked SusC/RagA family outer membrane protein
VIFYVKLKMHAMNQKDKFFMLLALSCLPLSEMAAEQVDGMAVSPITQEVLQNSVKITGKVVDVQGEPVIGATVMEKGTTNGIITDVDGNFTLNVSPNRKLQVSYVGYQTQEITIGSNRTLRITLKEDSELLDEVVVVGYGTMKKSDLTGAISSVSTETLVRGGNANAIGALQGSVAGVSILKSNNKPGGGYDIKIRGVSSISGSSAPLVVIDGIPGASLDNINPDDIEKIDILKDASSTAIYGSRATNGVVMVTTKKGSLGDPKISYSGYAGFRNYTHVPEMMSGDEYVQLAMENARALNNNNYKTLEEIFTDPSELKAAKDRNYYDWVDAITSPAFMTSHTISATGGTEKAKYTLGGGYYFEDGMQFPQEFSRYNMRAAVDLKANDYLSFGGSLYMTHSVRDTGNSSLMVDALRMRPTQHPYSLVTGEEIWKYTSNGMFNPLITNQNEFNKTKKLNILSNVYVKLTPVKGLELTSSFASNMTNDQIGQYRGVWTKALQGTAKGATNLLDKNNYTNWVWDNIVRYSWEHKIHKIDFTGVYSLQQNQDEKMRGASKDLPFNSLWYNLQGGEMTSMTSSYVQSNLMSFLGRINYTLADKYMLTASLRYDGSSKLADGNKWSLFPSVAVAWRLKEEAFMQSVDWLSNLKLRLSYGQTGNDTVSPYSTNGTIAGSQYYSFGTNTVIGTYPNNIRNDKLGWERTSEYNVGVDFGFFDNRISGSVEYYNRLTKDLIMNKSIPTHLGYSSVRDNVGSVRNQGFEIMLNTENIRLKDFSWQTTFTLSYNKNEIVDLAFKEDLGVYSDRLKGMQGDYNNRWFIGQPVQLNWDLETIGVWQLGEEEAAKKYGQKPGQFKVSDYNNDGVINDKDRFINGSRIPNWTGGMTNTFRYQEFDLSFHMHFQTGARLRNQFYVSYALENNNANLGNMKKDYWTPENPTNSCAQPSNMGPYRDQNTTGKSVSHIVQKTDFLKVSYITLGYTFKKNLLNRIKMSNLRLYATVQNPFTFTGFSGFDPEQPSEQVSNSDMITCNVLFGLNVSF